MNSNRALYDSTMALLSCISIGMTASIGNFLKHYLIKKFSDENTNVLLLNKSYFRQLGIVPVVRCEITINHDFLYRCVCVCVCVLQALISRLLCVAAAASHANFQRSSTKTKGHR